MLSTGKQLCTVESSMMSGWVIKDTLVNHRENKLIFQPWILDRVFNILFEIRWSAMNCALQLMRSEIFSLWAIIFFAYITLPHLLASLLGEIFAFHYCQLWCWKEQSIEKINRSSLCLVGSKMLRYLLMKDVNSTGTTDSWQKISVSSGGTSDELLTHRWWVFDTSLLNSWCLFD